MNKKVKFTKNVYKKIIIFILIISIVVFLAFVLKDYNQMKNTKKDMSDIITIFDQKLQEDFYIDNNAVMVDEQQINANSFKINNYDVYGKIKIDKINIEYPIIQYTNDNDLWKSICKISKKDIDGTGNLCLIGHNMRNATMFTKIKDLNNGDKIEITNTKGEKFIYKVYEKLEVNENQIEVLNDTSESIITLLTCKSFDYSKRIIVKGLLL